MTHTMILLCLAVIVKSNIIQGTKATETRRKRGMNPSEWNKLMENQSTVMYIEAEEVIEAQIQFNVSTL